MNPLRIISLAQKQAGVLSIGQTPNAEDTIDAFDTLNLMLSMWNRERWLMFHLVDTAATGTQAQFLTVGPGQDFDTPRPDSLEYAYVRLLSTGTNAGSNSAGQTDIPLIVLQSREDYSAISLKSLKTFPSVVFYDAAFPYGKLYVWPIPDAHYEIHIVTKDIITQFPDLVTDVNLPPEYLPSLVWNLAAELRPMYGLPPDPTITAKAVKSMAVIRGANSSVPLMSMPAGLSRRGGTSSSHGTGGNIPGSFTFDRDGMT